MKLVRLNEELVLKYRGDLEELSKATPCPLGQHWYYTSFGRDYFSYFQSIGEPYLYGVIDKEKLVASVMLILANYNIADKVRKAWYICDFKIHPTYRNHTVSPALFKSEFFLNYLKAPRGFAIFTNKKTEPSRVLELADKFKMVPFHKVEEINNYFITAQELRKISDDLKFYKTSFKTVDLKDTKDLFLLDNKKRINVNYLHFSLGQMEENQIDDSALFSFCLTASDSLNAALAQKNIFPNTTGSIVAHNMAGFDWKNLNADQI